MSRSKVRPYQLELYEQARQGNIIAYLDTGSGKTLVSILLMQDHVMPTRPIPHETLQLFQSKRQSHNQWARELHLKEQQLIALQHEPRFENSRTELEADIQALALQLKQNEHEMKASWPRPLRHVLVLVPTVPLVMQQAAAIRSSTDLQVGEISSDPHSIRVVYDYFEWQYAIASYQVLVMTPQICLNVLRHGLSSMRDISLLIFDECHHAIKNHPYNCILREFYHPFKASREAEKPLEGLPKIFGMTASPILAKLSSQSGSLEKLVELQQNLDSVIVTVKDRSSLDGFFTRAKELLVEYPVSSVLSDTSLESRLDLVLQQDTPSAQFYLQHVAQIIMLYNAAANEVTAQRMERLLHMIAEMRSEWGIWCAGQLAYIYAEAQRSATGRAGVKRKMKEEDSSANTECITKLGREDPINRLPTMKRHSFESTTSSHPAVSSTTPTTETDARILSFEPAFLLPPLTVITSHTDSLRASDLSGKALKVIELLRESATSSLCQLKTLIFVSKRVTARVVSDLLNRCASLDIVPHLVSSYITGHGGTHSLKMNTEMSSSAQSKTLQKFRRGVLNTLVLTSVGEEGLDVPACHLVIVADGLQSATSYVQTRGRARHHDSLYAIMCPKNDEIALQTIAKAKVTAHLVQKTCEQLMENGSLQIWSIECDPDERDDAFADEMMGLAAEDDPFIVQSTSAQLNLDSSLGVLNRYCSSLGRDQYTAAPRPQFREVTYESKDGGKAADGYGFTYEVRLPPSSPLCGYRIRGGRRLTKKMAMQSVALQICKLLHERGALNDHLLAGIKKPDIQTNGPRPNKKSRSSSVHIDLNEPDTSVNYYKHCVPETLSKSHWKSICGRAPCQSSSSIQQWIASKTQLSLQRFCDNRALEKDISEIELCSYLLEFDSLAQAFIHESTHTSEKRLISFILLTMLPLPDLPEIKLDFEGQQDGSTVTVKPFLGGKMKLNAEQWRLARDFQTKLFSVVLKQPPSSQVNPTDFTPNDEHMFKLLPATLGPNRNWEVDWAKARSIGGVWSTQTLLNYLSSLNGQILTNTASTFTNDMLEKLNLRVSPFILRSTYNNLKYVFKKVDLSMNGYSIFETERTNVHPSAEDQDTSLTFVSYLNNRHNVEVKYPLAPLVEVQHSPGIKNMLQRPRTQSKPGSTNTSADRKLYLLPELCEVVPVDCVTSRAALLLPSIFRRIETMLIVEELGRHLHVPEIALLDLFEACCASSTMEYTNYERLETLGDSLLKFLISMYLFRTYPNQDEGHLSAQRSHLVCNQALFHRGVENDLPLYILSNPFYPRQWAPPEVIPWIPSKKQQDRQQSVSVPATIESSHRQKLLSNKTIADVVEALLAVIAVRSGYNAAWTFLKEMGILPSDHDPAHAPIIESSFIQFNSGEGPQLLQKKPQFDRFQKDVLGYQFNNVRLLYEAMTHSSYYDAHTSCYQRLEFLGDAMLDWFIVRYFYMTYPNIEPSKLTDLRQIAVNNESFGRQATKLQLHRLLLHDSNALTLEVESFVHWYIQESHEDDDPVEIQRGAPKVLSDIFESLCGSILVDTGFDIEKTWSVIEPLYKPFLEQFCQPAVIGKHPVRLFHELCHQKGYQAHEIVTQFQGNEMDRVQCTISIRGKVVSQCEGNTSGVAKRLACLAGLQALQK